MNEISNIDMEKPFFTPWIGENYFNGIDCTGIKVMVVGASHYCSPGKKPEDPIDTDIKINQLARYERITKCAFRDLCLKDSADEKIKCPDPQNGDIHNPNNTGTTLNVINDELLTVGDTIHRDQGYLKTFNNFQSAFVNEYVRKPEERKQFWNSVIFYNYYQDFRGDAKSGKFDWERANIFFKPFANTVSELNPDIIFCWGAQVASVMRENAELKIIENEKYTYKSSIGDVHPIVVLVRHPSQGFSYKSWHEHVKKAFEIAMSNKSV